VLKVTEYILNDSPQDIFISTPFSPKGNKIAFVLEETQIEEVLEKLLYCRYHVSEKDLHSFRLKRIQNKCSQFGIGVQSFSEVIENLENMDDNEQNICTVCGSRYKNKDKHENTKKHLKMSSKWNKLKSL